MINNNLGLWRAPILLLWLVSHETSAHPGKANAEGCHTNRKTGDYHCHHASPKSPSKASSDHIQLASIETAHDATPGGILKLDYQGFTVWLDCSRRGVIKFRYNAQRDAGHEKRADRFALAPDVPAECQQFSAKAYGHHYDRGHQVSANHMDASELAIKQTNYMTNILPQAANMNRGAWYQTEKIIECYRDIDELLVIGGVIWGDNPEDDYFVQTHGVKTPDAFWKVVIRGSAQDERAIAWIVPNSENATKNQLDRYLVTVDELERITGETFPVADYAKYDKPGQSWVIPIGCNES